MTYQHKRDQCAKGTRQILTEQVLELKKTEYALIKGIRTKDDDTRSEDLNVIHAEKPDEGEHYEDYSPPEQVKFSPSEAKESFEKKKKKRNYLESREG